MALLVVQMALGQASQDTAARLRDSVGYCDHLSLCLSMQQWSLCSSNLCSSMSQHWTLCHTAGTLAGEAMLHARAAVAGSGPWSDVSAAAVLLPNCCSFVAIPIGSYGALLIGCAGRPSEAALQLVWELASQLGRPSHAARLQQLAGLAGARLLSHAPARARAGPDRDALASSDVGGASDLDEGSADVRGTSSRDCSQDDGSTSWRRRRRSSGNLLSLWPGMDPLLLSFQDPSQEADFLAWHARAVIQVGDALSTRGLQLQPRCLWRCTH